MRQWEEKVLRKHCELESHRGRCVIGTLTELLSAPASVSQASGQVLPSLKPNASVPDEEDKPRALQFHPRESAFLPAAIGGS